MSIRPIAQPKNGTYNSSRLKTYANGCDMIVGSRKVSSVDWCLHASSTAACPSAAVGRCSMPVTRQCTPAMRFMPHMAELSQPTQPQ